MDKKLQIKGMAEIIGSCEGVSDYDCDQGTCAQCKAIRVYNAGHHKPEEGNWIYKYEGKDIAYCSICNFYVQDKINNVAYCYHYCPNCGANMKGSN